MQLTLHADFALRVLLYLGSQPDGHVARTKEISETYRISHHHLVRVIQTLNEKGYVDVTAGRAGGVALAREPEQIRLGDVVQDVETNLQLVECFDPATNTCPIITVCQLKSVLSEALRGFIEVLNRYTLADILQGRRGKRLAAVFADLRNAG